MDGGPWWATVHGVAKSRTQLSEFTLSSSLKSGSMMLPTLFFFLKFALALWDLLQVQSNLRIACFINMYVKNSLEFELNVQIILGSVDILTILSLPIHNQSTSFHLFLSS